LLEWERFPEDNRLAGDAGIDAGDGGAWALRETFVNARDRCWSLGGGWRLPTVKELLTIVDEDPHKIYVDGGTPDLYVDRNAFPTTLPEPYWSSSPKLAGFTVWTVNFGNALPEAENLSTPHPNRCVRVSP
jgi:hypothetical protein